MAAINKPDMPINDVGMMAIVLLELGFTPDEMTGLANKFMVIFTWLRSTSASK